MARGRSRIRKISSCADPFSEENLRKRGYHSIKSFDQTFNLEKRWKLVREMGSGAYGVVISAADEISGETVAIKMVTRIFAKTTLAKRALRELTLLRHFSNHENITGLIDVDGIAESFSEMYLFMEPMEADLHQIIKSGQTLTNEHVQYFTYQILRGMKYVHSASVIHRDLKPGNLLVNSDCELKICDFGLSRGFDSAAEEGATPMTEYVATRWYRAPEIMLALRYLHSIPRVLDVWSIGCILAELLLGRPLFKGKDYVDQLNKILEILAGTPNHDTLKRVASERAQAYVRSLPIRKKVPFKKLIPHADPQGSPLTLLEKMLSLDPYNRIGVTQALAHPWLATYHDVEDEPACPQKFDRWREIEALQTVDELRVALWDEINDFRREVRAVGAEADEQPSALPSEVSVRSVSVPSDAQLSPQREDQSPAIVRSRRPSTSNSPVNERRSSMDERARPRTRDPVVSYARRTSVYSARDRDSIFVEQEGLPVTITRTSSLAGEDPGLPPASLGANAFPFPSTGPPEGYVVPARQRTTSAVGGPPGAGSRLLRTLSTVSIHEIVNAGVAAEVARLIRAKETAADAPPSEMPKEIGGEGSESRGSDDRS
ncbi:kinase-like protein [Russula earlei]|uniref:Kinase-like protein n=1 Tax=Russula earlei TaxID=71964 RepID=A0ACC0U651_9AGAM|nr:kinase-like protein [Russula earlei]